MLFNALYESALRGELLLVEGGLCHWHLRRDGQLTIREIISTKPGVGTAMLEHLKRICGAKALVAKCPAELRANDWYARCGFRCTGEERTRRGGLVRVWRLDLS